MAKRKKATGKGGATRKGGPYLASAVFCETTIEDKADSAISVIRIIDKITLTLGPDAPPDFPSKEKKLQVGVAALISFKTGDAPGEHTLQLVIQSPSGKKSPPSEHKLHLSSSPHGGMNFRLKSVFSVYEGGLFWVDVILDGRLFTRMPIEILIQRGQLPQTGPEGLPPR